MTTKTSTTTMMYLTLVATKSGLINRHRQKTRRRHRPEKRLPRSQILDRRHLEKFLLRQRRKHLSFRRRRKFQFNRRQSQQQLIRQRRNKAQFNRHRKRQQIIRRRRKQMLIHRHQKSRNALSTNQRSQVG